MQSMIFTARLWSVLAVVILSATNPWAIAQEKKDKKDKGPPVTKAPPTKAPATEAPATKAPSTKAPAAKAPATTEATPAADTNRPAAAEYQRLLEDWKTILKDMRKLKLQYQSGGFADQAEAQKGWTALVDKGNEAVAALEAAGLKAYTEAPNEDPQLTRFLIKLADD